MRLTSAPTEGAAPQKTVADERFVVSSPNSDLRMLVTLGFAEQSNDEYPRSSADAVVAMTLANAIAPKPLMIFMVFSLEVRASVGYGNPNFRPLHIPTISEYYFPTRVARALASNLSTRTVSFRLISGSEFRDRN